MFSRFLKQQFKSFERFKVWKNFLIWKLLITGITIINVFETTFQLFTFF